MALLAALAVLVALAVQTPASRGVIDGMAGAIDWRDARADLNAR